MFDMALLVKFSMYGCEILYICLLHNVCVNMFFTELKLDENCLSYYTLKSVHIMHL